VRTTLRVCRACARYSLRDACPSCGACTVSPLPPRYSPEDRYGEYRRRLRRLGAA
jgi:H/ACA ribonucleoprotein complex subunit 3